MAAPSTLNLEPLLGILLMRHSHGRAGAVLDVRVPWLVNRYGPKPDSLGVSGLRAYGLELGGFRFVPFKAPLTVTTVPLTGSYAAFSGLCKGPTLVKGLGFRFGGSFVWVSLQNISQIRTTRSRKKGPLMFTKVRAATAGEDLSASHRARSKVEGFRTRKSLGFRSCGLEFQGREATPKNAKFFVLPHQYPASTPNAL